MLNYVGSKLSQHFYQTNTSDDAYGENTTPQKHFQI